MMRFASVTGETKWRAGILSCHTSSTDNGHTLPAIGERGKYGLGFKFLPTSFGLKSATISNPADPPRCELARDEGWEYYRSNAAILARFRYLLPQIDVHERNRLVSIALKMERRAKLLASI